MAVRKNPDWSVWLADVWHWARQPPGIYICITVLLAGALIYSLSGPPVTRLPTQTIPQTVPSQPTIVNGNPVDSGNCSAPWHWDQQAQTCILTSNIPPTCAAGYEFVEAWRKCAPISRDPRCNLAGTVYVERLGRCLPTANVEPGRNADGSYTLRKQHPLGGPNARRCYQPSGGPPDAQGNNGWCN